MRIMLRHRLNQQNLLHKLSRWNFIKTGLLIMALAACFMVDRSYFFYPPSLAPMWNNFYVDIIGFIAGLILFLCGACDIRNDLIVKVGLGVSAAFLTVLVIAESFHVIGLGYYLFHPIIIFEFYSIVNLMQIAYEYDPRY